MSLVVPCLSAHVRQLSSLLLLPPLQGTTGEHELLFFPFVMLCWVDVYKHNEPLTVLCKPKRFRSPFSETILHVCRGMVLDINPHIRCAESVAGISGIYHTAIQAGDRFAQRQGWTSIWYGISSSRAERPEMPRPSEGVSVSPHPIRRLCAIQEYTEGYAAHPMPHGPVQTTTHLVTRDPLPFQYKAHLGTGGLEI